MVRGLVLSLVWVGIGCSGSGTGSSSTGSTGSMPVSHSPLTGTFNGQPWTAGYGVAIPDFGDATKEQITVYASGSDGGGCNSFFMPTDNRELLTSIPWTANYSADLNLSQNFTFAYQDSTGTDQNDVAIIGRLELDAAPTAPDGGSASTTMRFRGSSGSADSVEGQVNILVCPGF